MQKTDIIHDHGKKLKPCVRNIEVNVLGIWNTIKKEIFWPLVVIILWFFDAVKYWWFYKPSDKFYLSFFIANIEMLKNSELIKINA